MRRFFCENCGEEVDESADLCPYCGAIFQAIKCPRCGYRGKMHEFRKGCPSCGFLGEDHVRETASPGGNGVPRETVGSIVDAGRPDTEGMLNTTRGGADRPTAKREKPAWLFWLVLAFMIVAFAGMAALYMSL